MSYIPLKKTKDRAIILVHGMGSHTAPTSVEATPSKPAHFKPGSFGQEFIDTSASIMASYEAYQGKSIADFYDIHEINYDVWFDKMRTTMADNAKMMSDRLETLSNTFGTTGIIGLTQRLTSLEAKFKDDKFFYTHWLDVLFYGTMLGRKVCVAAAAVVADAITQYDAANVHIIAHSLGTAVIHDTLHALYHEDLNVVTHEIRSLWMFANVSRLVNTVNRYSDPLGSVVRPGNGGCVSTFFNVRHKLDPFTWLAQFNPENDDSWTSSLSYNLDYTTSKRT